MRGAVDTEDTGEDVNLERQRHSRAFGFADVDM